MSNWPATKAKRVLAALERIGWRVIRQKGSHRVLARESWPNFEFAFHDNQEVGPRMLSRIAKCEDLTTSDLWRPGGEFFIGNYIPAYPNQNWMAG